VRNDEAIPCFDRPQHLIFHETAVICLLISTEETIMVNKKVTGKSAASNSSKTLGSESTAKTSTSAAGSALSQRSAPGKQTSKTTASAASKTLSDGRTSEASKSAAGSALAQKDEEK
jgi:hypothetical protein